MERPNSHVILECESVSENVDGCKNKTINTIDHGKFCWFQFRYATLGNQNGNVNYLSFALMLYPAPKTCLMSKLKGIRTKKTDFSERVHFIS